MIFGMSSCFKHGKSTIQPTELSPDSPSGQLPSAAAVHFRPHAGSGGRVPLLAVIGALLFRHPVGIVHLFFDAAASVFALGINDIQQIPAMGIPGRIIGKLPVTCDAIGNEFTGFLSARVKAGIEKAGAIIVAPLIPYRTAVRAFTEGNPGPFCP